ncbi:hypothetical protein D3C73_1085840 [compost metagenome]
MRAVIHRDGHHSFGQRAVDLLELAGHRLGNRAAVFTDQHEHCAQHYFTAVFRGCTAAQLTADFDSRDISDADRRAVDVGHDDVGDVFDACHLPRCTDQQLLAAALDVTSANVGIVALQCRHQVGEGQFVGGEFFRVRGNLVLLGKPTDGVDLGHARYVAQLRLDDPVLDHPQISRRVRRAVLLERAFLRLHGPQENLAQSGGDRPHQSFGTFG